MFFTCATVIIFEILTFYCTQQAPRLALLRTFRDQTKSLNFLRWNPHTDSSRSQALGSHDQPLSNSTSLKYHHYWLACSSDDHTIGIYDTTRLSTVMQSSTEPSADPTSTADQTENTFSPGQGCLVLLKGHQGPVKGLTAHHEKTL